MISALITQISNLALSVFSSSVYDKGKSLIENHKCKKDYEAIEEWIEEYINSHSGIFEKGKFYDYIKYQNPFHRIYQHLTSIGSPKPDEQSFINEITLATTKYMEDAGQKCSIQEQYEISEFYHAILEKYKYVLSQNFSNEGTILAYELEQNTAQQATNNATMNSKLDSILAKLENNDESIPSDVAQEIYRLLSAEIWKGNFNAAERLIPTFSAKCVDLECAIKIKLSMLSDYPVNQDKATICGKIASTEIRDDVIRFIIGVSIDKDGLKQYLPMVVNPKLKNILNSVVNDDWDSIMIMDCTERKNVTEYRFKPAADYSSEEWLYQRLCISRICALNVANIASTIRATIKSPNFLDYVTIWNEEMKNTANKYGGDGTVASDLKSSIVEMKASFDLYKHTHSSIQSSYYLTLIRAMNLVEDPELFEILHRIPDAYTAMPQLKAYVILEKIKNGSISEDELLSFVIGEKEYWLLGAYCEFLNDNEKAMAFLDKIQCLRSQNVQIILLNATFTARVKGKAAAYELMKEYQDTYKEYLDFWLLFYRTAENADDKRPIIQMICKIIENRIFKYGSIHSQIEAVEILTYEDQYETAEYLLDAIENLGNITVKTIKLRVQIYVSSNRNVEALTLINTNYNILSNDARMMDLLLSLSLQYRRTVPDEVLVNTKQFKNSRILLLTAEFEEKRGNQLEAENLAMKASLLVQPNQESLLGNAIKFFHRNANNNKSPLRVTGNCYITLENETGEENRAICVYKNDILPTAEMNWKGAEHIDLATAASYGLIRKSQGEKVSIKGNSYIVKGIEPIEVFYFNTCMTSMIAQRTAIPIYADDAATGLQKMEQMFREHTDPRPFQEIYSDNSTIALPFFYLKKYTHAEYGEFIQVMQEDPSIILREPTLPANNVHSQTYVLTYSAVIELYKLGVEPSQYNASAIIPSSIIEVNKTETDSIIAYNDQNLVASMGIFNNKFSLLEKDEETKGRHIKDALERKTYVSQLRTSDNTHDIDWGEMFQGNRIDDVIGISDYDALALAHFNSHVLVTDEMMLAALALNSPGKCDVCGVSDFLCSLGLSPIELILILKKKMAFRSTSVTTPCVVDYLGKNYSTGENGEAVLEKWAELLNYPKEMQDSAYEKAFAISCADTLRGLKFEEMSDNPIYRLFLNAVYYYVHVKLHLDTADN